ncbi:MAG: copper amine oxidase N-terminal domain-containing protein [Peptococcaceae bacterium]|nr:copper amine oxidase N-terminal domain-containing protein [Peptococcaceae bacterium]
MKKPVVILLAVLSLFVFALSAWAGQVPEPYVQDGVSMMPLRLITEANGAQVIWDASGAAVVIREVVTRPVVVDDITGAVISPAETGTLAARFVPGSSTAVINGVAVGMEAPAAVRDGRMYVPAQMVSLLFSN